MLISEAVVITIISDLLAGQFDVFINCITFPVASSFDLLNGVTRFDHVRTSSNSE